MKLQAKVESPTSCSWLRYSERSSSWEIRGTRPPVRWRLGAQTNCVPVMARSHASLALNPRIRVTVNKKKRRFISGVIYSGQSSNSPKVAMADVWPRREQPWPWCTHWPFRTVKFEMNRFNPIWGDFQDLVVSTIHSQWDQKRLKMGSIRNQLGTRPLLGTTASRVLHLPQWPLSQQGM